MKNTKCIKGLLIIVIGVFFIVGFNSIRAKASSKFNYTYAEKFDGVNNIIENAERILPEKYYDYDTYMTTLTGELHIKSYSVDYDYFYFNVLTDTYVDFKVTSSGTNDYFFQVLNYSNYQIVDNESQHSIDQVYSETSSGKCSFSNLLTPGTYYIGLNSIGQEDCKFNYTVILNFRKATPFKDVDINKMKEKNLLGAVWVSDYLPSKEATKFSLEDVLYYEYAREGVKYKEHILDDLDGYFNDPILLANYYIWDPGLKYVIGEITNELKIKMMDLDDKITKMKVRYEFVTNALDGVFKIIAYFGPEVIDVPLKIARDAINVIGQETIKRIIDMISPIDEVYRIDYQSYLIKVSEAFCMAENSYEDAVASNDKSVIQLPIYYSIVRQRFTATRNERSYYSYADTFNYIVRLKTLKYNYSTIVANKYNSNRCGGKIYELNHYNDFYEFVNLNLVSQDCFYEEHYHSYNYEEIDADTHKVTCECGYSYLENHTSKNHKCVHCGASIEVCDYSKSFKYINDLTHYAYCSCGKVKKANHFVKSGSNICILCKGKARIGFVGPGILNSKLKKITDNGSYVSPTGVIVLQDADIEAFLNHTLKFKNVGYEDK